MFSHFETADGVLSGIHSLGQLIAASNEVAGATAQLAAASLVKADLMSKTQERLEVPAKGRHRGMQGTREARSYDLGEAA